MAAPVTTQIRRRKLYEDVAARIEDRIRSGAYREGAFLPAERDIALEYGVGRSSVREAIFSLQRMGLVAATSGARARVVAPSAKALVGELSGAARLLLAQPSGVEQFQDARALFEIGLARLAAERAGDDDIAALRDALAANRASLGNPAAFQATDIAFHYVIAAIPKNSIFTSIHEAMAEWLMEQRIASTQVSGAAEAASAAHRRIFDAIAARDAIRSEMAMAEHLAAVKAFYWQAVAARHETPGAP